MTDTDLIPWSELTDREKQNFVTFLNDVGITVSVDEAEPYYGNREKIEREGTQPPEGVQNEYACPNCFGDITREHIPHLKRTGECPHCGHDLTGRNDD